MILNALFAKRKGKNMDETKNDVVTVTEKQLEKVVGGSGVFDDVPRVDEHDYDDDTRDKA